PRLEIVAIAGEYHEALEHVGAIAADRRHKLGHSFGRPGGSLVLWLGANIGNLEREEAARLLTRGRSTLPAADRLLVGIDLRKDRATLEAAYFDACGVTAAFNRNLLARVNSELGGHFDVRSFEHRAVYNDEAGRVEMYLVSTRAQHLSVDRVDLSVEFAAGEAVHTENSYKYSA